MLGFYKSLLQKCTTEILFFALFMKQYSSELKNDVTVVYDNSHSSFDLNYMVFLIRT